MSLIFSLRLGFVLAKGFRRWSLSFARSNSKIASVAQDFLSMTFKTSAWGTFCVALETVFGNFCHFFDVTACLLSRGTRVERLLEVTM